MKAFPIPQGCVPFRECRAKTCPDGSPGTCVFDHCRYAGYVAEGLLALLPKPVRRLLPPETPFLVSLHDIGKVSPGFEGKYFIDILRTCAPEWASEFAKGGVTTDHASIGARALMLLFGFAADHPLVRTVAAHHGFAPERLLFTRDGSWQAEREGLVRELAREFGANPDVLRSVRPEPELLAGITCVSDWIASDESFFPPDEPFLSSEDGRHRAARALAACGFRPTSFRPGLSFRDIFGFDPYPAQQAFLDAASSPGVYVLEAPMGMGKTESALYAAYRLVEAGHHSGLYFALPTRLTSDRIHERVRAFLEAVSEERTAVKLAHGQAWLRTEDESDPPIKQDWGAEGIHKTDSDGECFEVCNPDDPKKPERIKVPRWFNPSKRGLLFPFAVGTIDQALLSVLNVKHSFVRSFALAGKVVVLDEVHSYDAYTGTLLDELVRRLRDLGCTVIILSATLTDARRKALLGPYVPDATGYPLLTGVRSDGTTVVRGLAPPPSRSVRLRWLDASAESPLAAAVAKARAGCNVLCIANTVATAQEWFRTLKSEMQDGDDFPVGLLHAKFTGADRERIEGEWMKKLGKPPEKGPDPRPHGSILVSTQIVEQSVDIDVDWMLSELAPADMLLQRLGRLWRHDRMNRPVPGPELAVVCAKMPADDLSDLPTETKELEEFFGRGVWVYAPYVLLRTFETLRGREAVRVPDDIRPLLETIYADIVPDTSLHHALYADMQEKAERLRRLAVMGQSDALPTRNDDEETAGTRYNSRPSVSLLLLRSLDRASNGHDFSATLLDGRSVTISPWRRDFAVTRDLYRNLVQVVPTEALRAKGTDADILGRHFFASDMPRICLWDPDSGILRLYGADKASGYAYHPQFGAYRIQRDETGMPEVAEQVPPPESPSEPVEPDTGIRYPSLADPEGDFIFENDNDW